MLTKDGFNLQTNPDDWNIPKENKLPDYVKSIDEKIDSQKQRQDKFNTIIVSVFNNIYERRHEIGRDVIIDNIEYAINAFKKLDGGDHE